MVRDIACITRRKLADIEQLLFQYQHNLAGIRGFQFNLDAKNSTNTGISEVPF